MKKASLSLALALCCSLLSAQTADSLIRRAILLEKEYIPTIENAGKIYQSPGQETVKTNKEKIVFALDGHPTEANKEIVPLRAAEARTHFPDLQKRGYLRVGGGNHFAFLGDGQLNILRQSRQTLDLNLWHRSQSVPAQDNHWNSDNRLQLNYKLHLGYSELEAGIAERFGSWHYYSDAPNPAAAQIPDNQWSSDTRVFVSMKSKPWDKTVDYSVQIEEHLFRLGTATTLGQPAGPTEAETHAQARLAWHFQDDWTAAIDGQVRYLGYLNSPYALGNRLWFELHPEIEYQWGYWQMALGARVSNGDGLKAALTASAQRDLGEKAAAGIFVDGGEKFYSYREGLLMNPYLSPDLRLETQYSPFILHADLWWRPLENCMFSPQMGFRTTQDMPLFYNVSPAIGTSGTKQASKLFGTAPVDASQWYVALRADVALYQMCHLNADIRYNHYHAYRTQESDALANLLANAGSHLWYKPNLEANLEIEVKPTERIALQAEYYWGGSRYAYTENEDCQRLDDLHLLSATCSYKVNAQIGAFASVWNLLNRRTEVWNRYASYGTTGVVGVSFSF